MIDCKIGIERSDGDGSGIWAGAVSGNDRRQGKEWNDIRAPRWPVSERGGNWTQGGEELDCAAHGTTQSIGTVFAARAGFEDRGNLAIRERPIV